MRIVKAIVATTHVDKHMDRISRPALEGMAQQANSSYVPWLNEHDFRQPLGRVVSAQVVPLAGDEFGLETTTEVWEPTDTPESVHGDGRTIRLEEAPDALFEVGYDIGTLAVELDILRDLARLAGLEETPRLLRKKAFEPVQTVELLIKLVGQGIALGILGKIGADMYDEIRQRLREVFRRATRPKTLRLRFWMDIGRDFEVDVFVEDPSPADIDIVFGGQFNHLDDLVRTALEIEPEAVMLVFRWWRGEFILLHAFRSDAYPIFFEQREVVWR